MKLEKREMTKNGRRDIYSIPGSEKKLIRERKMSYIRDENGRIVSKMYDTIRDFKYGLAVVEKGKFKGVISESGEEILKPVFENLNLDGNVIRICSKSKWGFVDCTGKVICDPQYFFLEKFANGKARFSTFDDKWGIIDINGQILVPPKYEFLGDIKSEVIVAKKIMEFGAIDIQDRVVVPFRFQKIGYEGTRTVIYNNSQDKIVV